MLRSVIWSALLLSVIGTLLFPGGAMAANITSTAAGGNWSATTTWVGGVVPVAGDNVTIAVNAVITVDADAACATITWAAGALTASRTLTINAGVTLTVSGAITYVSPAAAFNRSINVLGTLNAASISMPTTGGNTQDCILAIGTAGIVNISGNLTMAAVFARNHVDMTGSATINIGGNVNNGAGAVGGGFTTPPATSTINLNGSAAQTVFLYGGATALGNLKINNALGVTSGSTMTIAAAGSLTIGDVTANSIFSDGGFQLTATGTLNLTSGTFKLGATASTTFPLFATRNIATGTTVEYASAAAQTVSVIPSYQNLVFSGAGAKTTAAGTLTIGGNWTIGSTTALNTNNTAVNLTGSLIKTGNLTSGTGAINISGDWTGNGGTFTSGTGGVTFNGGGTQTINGTLATQTFGVFTVNKSAGTLTIGGSTTSITTGNVTLTAGEFAPGGALINLAGNWTNNGGTFTASTSSVRIAGAGRTIGGTASTTFSGLNISSGSTVTANTSLTADSLNFDVAAANTSLTLGSGAVVLTVNNGLRVSQPANTFTTALNVNAGTANISGTTTVGSGVAANGVAQVAVTTGSLTFSGPVNYGANNQPADEVITLTNNGSITFRQPLTLSSGTVSNTVAGTINFDGGLTFGGANAPALTTVAGTNVNFGGSLSAATTALTLNATSNAAFTGTATITPTSAITFGNLEINPGASNTVGLAGNVSIAGNLNVASGLYDINTFTSNRSAAGGTLTIASGASLLAAGSSGGLTGSNYPSNFTTNTLNGLVEFDGTGAQTVPALNYTNLTVSNARTTNSVTLAGGTIGVAGIFSPTASFTSGAYVVTGNTVNYNGTGAQTVRAFNYNNLTISGARTTNNVTLEAGGTLGVAGTFSPSATFTSGSYITTNNTVDFNGTGAQTVPVFSYNNLTLSGSRGANSITLAAGTINIAGTLSTTASFTSGGITTTGNTVVFNGAGTQSITGTLTIQPFNHLTVDKSSGTLTVTGSTTALSLGGNFSLVSGTFTAPTTMTIAGAVSLSAPGGTWNAGSTTNVAGNWTNNAGTFTSGDGLVVMNGSSAQVIGGTQSTTFRSLTIQNAAGVSLSNTITLSKNPPSAGNLTINSGTLTDNGYQITGNDLGTVNIGSGAGLTLGTPGSATLFPINYLTVNVHIASTVTYNSGLSQSVYPITTPGYGIIAFSGGGTKTLTGTLLARGGLSIGANTTLDDAGYQITGASGYPMTMAANSVLILGNSTTATSFPTGFTNSDITLTSPSTIVYNSNQSQTISTVPTYRTLSLQSSGTVTKTAAGGLTADNLIIGSNNTLDGAGYVITVNNDVTNNGTFSGTGSGKVRLAGSSAQQLAGNGTYYKLQLANGAGATLTGSPTISDSLVLTTGNLTVGANTLTLNGPALDSAETKIIAGATSSFVFGGVEDTLYLPKNISALKSLHVNLSTTDSKLNHSAPLTINDTLKLTLGILDMFQYPNPPTRVDTVTIASTGSINIIGGRVKGGLRRWVPVNAGTQTISWPVGGADVKTQVDITFTNVTTAGWLTIRMFASDHPLINSSGINPSKSVNRYWMMRNSGIAFTSADVTLGYAGTSDVDAGANWNNFAVSRYNPLTASWLPLSVGSRTSTSTQATGSTVFGDFQVGELGEKVWTGGGDGTSWGDANNWTPAGVPTNISAVKIRSAANISITTAATANSLVMNNSGLTLTIGTAGSLTITSDFTDSTGTLNTQAAFPTVGGTVSLLGGTVGYTASGPQSVSSLSYNNLALSGSGAKTFSGTTNIAGDFTIGGTATATTTGTTIVFNGTSSQAIAATTYNNLTINGSGTKTLAGTTIVGPTGALTLTSGTLDVSSNTLTLNGAVSATSGVLTSSPNGTVNYNQSSGGQNVLAATYGNLTFSAFAKTLPGSGTISIAGTFTPAGSGHTITGSTIDFNGAGAQAVPAFDYNNLTISGSRGGAAVTLVNGGTIRVAGVFNPSATSVTYTTTGNTFVFNGSSAQNSPAFTFNNLTLSNASGLTLTGIDSVYGTLDISSNIIATGSYKIALGSSATLSRTTGFINGNLQKYIATGAPTVNFEIGAGSNYTPITGVTFVGVTTAGNLIASSTSTEHPQIASSTIDGTKSVNRHWTLSNDWPVPVYTSYSAVFNFVAGDVDVGATTGNFIVSRYASSTWTLPTAGTANSTSTAASGITGIGDFAIGEPNVAVTKTWDGGASTNNWGDANNWNPDGVPSSANNVNLTGANTININVSAAANTLSLDNSGLVLTILTGQSLTVSGNLVMNNGTLDLQNGGSAFPAVTGSVSLLGGSVSYTASGAQNISTQSYYHLALGGSGTKTFGGTTNIAGNFTIGGTATTATSGTTIVFNGSGAQAVAATAYNNLTINGSGTKTLASGTTTVDGTLTLTTGTLDVAANTLTLNGTVSATSGLITSQATGTVNYNQGSGGQAILAGTYGNLTFSAFSKTLASSGTIAIAGTFTPAGSGHTVTGSTIDFNAGSGSQTIPAFIYNNLTLSGAASKSIAASTITVGGNLSASGGTVTATGSTVDFNASSGSQSVGAINYDNLTFTNAGATRVFASGQTTGIAGTFTAAGTVTVTGSTLDFNGAGQTIPNLTYNNLTLSGSGTKTLGTALTIGGNFTVTGVSVAPGTGTVTFSNTSGSQSVAATTYFNLTFSGNSTKTLASGATTYIGNNFAVSGGSVTTTGSTVELTRSTGTQVFAAINYNNLTFSNNGNREFNSGTTGIAGTLLVNAGTVDVTTNSSLVEYNGSSAQTIEDITYWQLRTNNASGFNLNRGDATVISILTLQSGNVSTGSNKLVLNTSNAISRTSGHVIGNLEYFVDNIGSPSRTFPIGDASNYTPVTVQFANVTTTGYLTASTAAGDHAQVGSSNVDGAKSVNRTWTLSNNGIVFSGAGYTSTFTFINPGDLDGGVNTSNVIVGLYNSGWTYPTVGTKTGTTTQITGQLTFGDFQIGEPSAFVPKTWDGGASTANWGDAANWNPDGVPTSSNNVTLSAPGATSINVNVAGNTNNLTINSSNITLTVNSGQSLTVAGNFLMSAGTMNLQDLTSPFPSVTGTVTMSGGTVGYTGSGAQNVSTQSYFSLNLGGSGAKTFSGTTNVAGDFTIGGTATATTTGTTIVFNGSSSQAVAATTYNNLTINGSGTKTLASGTTTVGGTLTLTSGTLDVAVNTLTLNSSVSVTSGVLTSQATGTVNYNQGSAGQNILAGSYGNLTFSAFSKTLPSSGTIAIAGTFTPAGSGHTITGSTIDFNGAGAQSVPAFSYNSLTISGNRGGAAVTLVNGGTIGVAGAFNASATNLTYTTTGNTVSFNGSGSQTATGFTYNNLTLNNSGGLTISGNTTVNAALTLSAGALTTGAFTVIIPSAGAVTRTSGFVSGNLQKNVATGASVSRYFEVGTGSTFAPVYVTYAQVNTAGNLIVSTTAGEHPQISTSGLDQTKNVNRYWTLTNSGIVATAAGYTADFSFVPANDKDAAATAANFIVKRYSGAWNTTSVGTRWSDSTQVVTEQNYGDFAVGEAAGAPTSTWDGGAGSNFWGDANNWNPNGVPTSTTNVDLSNASTIDINTAASTASLTLSNGGLTLTIKSGQSLTVNGNLTIQNGTLNTETTFPTIVGGSVSITGGTVGYTALGAQDVSNQSYVNLSLGGSGTKTLPAGTTNISGNYTVTGVTVDAGTNSSTLNFNGGGAQSVAATTYYNLTLANAGTKTFAAGTTTIAGAFSITGSAAANATSFTTTIDYVGGAQSVVGMAYSTLRISGSGTKTLGGAATVAADLDVAVGTLDLVANTLNRASSGGTLSLASGTTLKLSGSSGGVSGSNFPSSFTTNTLTGTVEFYGSGSQTIPALNFTDLTSSSTGARVLASSGTIGVAGVFTAGSNTYTVNGSTMNFNGGTQTIPSFNGGTGYNNLSTSGSSTTKTIASAVIVSGNFTNGASVTTSVGTQTLTISGTKTNSGTMQFAGASNGLNFTGGTVEYNGTSAQAPAGQTIALGTYNNLVFTNDAVKTITGGTVRTQSSLTVSAGIAVDITGTGIFTVDLDLTLIGTFTNNGTVNVGN